MRYLVLLLAAILTGCSGESSEVVRFVMPPDFSGPIAIIVDANADDAIEVRDGVNLITVPDDGVVRVNNDAIFRGWHKVEPAGRTGVTGGREMVSPAFDGSIIWYYHGTVDDFNEFLDGSLIAGPLREWVEQRGLIKVPPRQERENADTP